MTFQKFARSILLFAVAATPIIGLAQASHRDQVIYHIEEVAFGRSNIYTPQSPVVEMLLAAAKSANPNINSEKWEKVKVDTAASLTRTLAENGGPMGGVLVGALDAMSDTELERVAQLLDDPAYSKFQAILASSAVQQRVLQKTAKTSEKINDAVNAAISSNGLIVPR